MLLTRRFGAARQARRFSTLLKQPHLVQFGPSGVLARFGVGIDQKANEVQECSCVVLIVSSKAALALMRSLDAKPFNGW